MTPPAGQAIHHTVGGTPRRIRLTDLRLDPQNPRLPPHMQDPAKTQLELLMYIDKRFNPLEVAESIARHGYFESEPLIAVEEAGVFVVVEGNRRLSALIGLSDQVSRAALSRQTKGWRTLPEAELPDELPVVVVATREQVAPLLGFRHISGIKEWEPFAQARYIVLLVEAGHDLGQVAEMVGRELTETRSMYRDHEIVRQASDVFGLDTRRVENDFGVFNAAMGVRNLRHYVLAPTPATTSIDDWPLGEDAREPLSRLLVFMYGDERGRGKVLPESRYLRQLGQVLADESGRGEQALLAGLDLEEALESLAEPTVRFRKRIQAALRALQLADEEEGAEPSEEDLALLGDISRLGTALLTRFHAANEAETP